MICDAHFVAPERNMKDSSVIRSRVRASQRALHADASSIFVVDGPDLKGSIADWDWTRTSFDVPIVDWPTVAFTLQSGAPRYMTRDSAEGVEAGWFESHGIASSLCVPLRSDDVCVGVVFFDFNRVRMPSRESVARVEHLAVAWAAALETA